MELAMHSKSALVPSVMVAALFGLWQVVPLKEMTLEELAKHDGSDKEQPLYLAIKGTVFDVSKGSQFYGPDGECGSSLPLKKLPACGMQNLTVLMRRACLVWNSAHLGCLVSQTDRMQWCRPYAMVHYSVHIIY